MKLAAIAAEVRRCRACPLWQTRRYTVPGEGPVHAALMVIGEAPGPTEDRTGRPFAGSSGKFLTKGLEKVGIARSGAFITSVLKCFPPGKRRPRAAEIAACLPYLQAQIAAIKPKVILLLGNTAINSILGKRYPLSSHHGRAIVKNKIIYILAPHPSAARRFPAMRRAFERDMRALRNFV